MKGRPSEYLLASASVGALTPLPAQGGASPSGIGFAAPADRVAAVVSKPILQSAMKAGGPDTDRLPSLNHRTIAPCELTTPCAIPLPPSLPKLRAANARG